MYFSLNDRLRGLCQTFYEALLNIVHQRLQMREERDQLLWSCDTCCSYNVSTLEHEQCC